MFCKSPKRAETNSTSSGREADVPQAHAITTRERSSRNSGAVTKPKGIGIVKGSVVRSSNIVEWLVDHESPSTWSNARRFRHVKPQMLCRGCGSNPSTIFTLPLMTQSSETDVRPIHIIQFDFILLRLPPHSCMHAAFGISQKSRELCATYPLNERHCCVGPFSAGMFTS